MDGWKISLSFLLGFGLFSGAVLVSGRVDTNLKVAKHCRANTRNKNPSKSLSFDLWLEAPWRTSLRSYRFSRAHGPVEPVEPEVSLVKNWWASMLHIHGFHHVPSDSVGGWFSEWKIHMTLEKSPFFNKEIHDSQMVDFQASHLRFSEG